MILAEAHRWFTQNFDLLLFKHFFSTTKKGSQVFTSHFQALSYTCAWRIDARNTDPAKKLHALFSAKIIEGLTHIFQEDLLPVLFSSSVIQPSKKRQIWLQVTNVHRIPSPLPSIGTQTRQVIFSSKTPKPVQLLLKQMSWHGKQVVCHRATREDVSETNT